MVVGGGDVAVVAVVVATVVGGACEVDKSFRGCVQRVLGLKRDGREKNKGE